MRKEDDDLYYGRVRSPYTHDRWEYGYFSRDQLEEARAYRVDENVGDHEPVFPDGGYVLDRDFYTLVLEEREEGEYRSEG